MRICDFHRCKTKISSQRLDHYGKVPKLSQARELTNQNAETVARRVKKAPMKALFTVLASCCL